MVRKSRQVREHNQLQERKHQAMASGKPAPRPTFAEKIEWGMVCFRICNGHGSQRTIYLCNTIIRLKA